MVRGVVSHSGKSDLVCHVDVAILVLMTSLDQSLQRTAIDCILPLYSAIRTCHLAVTLCCSPLVKAGFVEIVTARGLTPDDGLLFLGELFAADWTVSLDGFTLSIFIFGVDRLGGQRSGVVEDLFQFRGQECYLKVQRLRRLQNFQQNIQDMLALWIASNTKVWAGALGHVGYLDCVDVACAASKVDLFHGTVWSLMWAVMITYAASVDDDHTLRRGSMGNSSILLWCLFAVATRHKLSAS